MSMDDQFSELQRFRAALETFSMQLHASMMDLEEKHENVSPHWQDESRRRYDSFWVPLQENIRNYVEKESPNYHQFLESKIEATRRYLYG